MIKILDSKNKNFYTTLDKIINKRKNINKSNLKSVERIINNVRKNKDKALKVLRSRLYELELSKKLALDSEKRSSLVSSGDRSAKIRTYNYPQGRVTDHRIGLTLYDLPNVINGDIKKLIDELQLYQNTEKLKEAGEVL